ncbi:uncharacterized protein LOC111340104 [Stylophora pistillata]|nr:uncharacterized protein LOC111340104 [Stylophora pistillata]
MRQGTALVLPVVIFFIVGSNIPYSSNAGIVTGKDNKEQEKELQSKKQFRRGIGEELNNLKDKANQASSVYKWLKRNWQKLFVIVVAIFSLLVVLGIYRRCFSDSGSGGDDEQPKVVVVKMLNQDHKERGTIRQANVTEGSSIGNENDGKRETSSAHGNNSTGHKGEANNSKVAEKSASRGRKIPIESSSVSIITKTKQHEKNKELTYLRTLSSKPDLNELTSHICALDGIPVSGYATFQQTDYYKLYHYFKQYISKEKSAKGQLSMHPIRVCQGSTCDGPFPFYENIALVKNVVTSLMMKYYDAYIPTAETNTDLPLTVSP